MKFWLPKWLSTGPQDGSRRRLLGGLLAGGGLVAINQLAQAATDSKDDEVQDEPELRFPGDPAEHQVAYQFNKSDPEYHDAVLFSVGAMLRQWEDNIDLVVVGIGPGLHILGKKPGRPVSEEVKQRVSSLAQYGVQFHACGNTMQALGWTEADLLPFVTVVEVGASDLMELQEQGYAYISW